MPKHVQRFKTGDIVQLVSGGPKMTVKDYSNPTSDIVFCQWFAGSKLESGAFPEDSLAVPTSDKK
jgi:uncharacterized protein YodC (DUF2158 family)